MRNSGRPFMKQIASCLVVLMCAQLAVADPLQQENVPAQTAQSAPANGVRQLSYDPALSDASPARAEDSIANPGADGTQLAQNAGAASVSSGSSANAQQEQSAPAKPVGTAAAPATGSEGIAGSKLTGAVIAPAKQRRVRTFLIRIGIVVGACVAIGTVVALSKSSPSQPRGAQ